jgi:AAA domain
MSTTPAAQPQAQIKNDPFEGLSGVIPATQIQEVKKLKAAIIGPPKNGKSWFAATAPGSKLVYDFDDRASSLAGKPNLVVKTLRDTITNPSTVSNLEADLSILKYRKAQGKSIPETFIFDTVSNLISNGIVNAYLKENPSDGRRIKLAGTNPQQIGISFDRINVTTRFLEYLLTEYSALGNVIFVFHERDEKDKAESTKDVIKYTGQVTIEPQFAANILTLFNDVFRILVKGSAVPNTLPRYEVYCRATNEVTASTMLLVDSIEPPNLVDMIAKHEARKAEQLKNKI